MKMAKEIRNLVKKGTITMKRAKNIVIIEKVRKGTNCIGYKDVAGLMTLCELLNPYFIKIERYGGDFGVRIEIYKYGDKIIKVI